MNKKNLLSMMLVLLLALAWARGQGQNEVSVSVNVLPPFSTRLSDYTDNPGKILITLQNQTGQAQDLYLQLTLACEDRGILLVANQNNSGAMHLTLAAYQPMQLNYLQLQQFFNTGVIAYQGITEAEVLRMNGLPEGFYTLCVQAFSYYNPGTPLSPDIGCATFFIQSIQPPVLILPEDQAGIQCFQPQNVIFSWTIPPGAQPGLPYVLTIIEMIDTTRPKEDYFQSGHIPPFFETSVYGNVFLYGPAQPALLAGRKYAWAVSLGELQPGQNGGGLVNQGRSEVRVFSCAGNENPLADQSSLEIVVPSGGIKIIRVSDTADFFVNAAWFDLDNTLPGLEKPYLSSSQLKLLNINHYRWALTATPKNKPKINLQAQWIKPPPSLNQGDTLLPLIGINLSQKQCDSLGLLDGKNYRIRLEAIDPEGNTLKECSKEFEYRRSSSHLAAMTRVKGSLHYRFKDYAETYPIASTQLKISLLKEIQLGNTPVFQHKPTGETAWYTSTDAEGKFSLDLPRSAGTNNQQHQFKLEIVSKYYQQPDMKFALDTIGNEQEVGKIVTEVYSYSLKLYVSKLFAREYTPVINNGQPGSGGGLHFQQSVSIDSSIQEPVKEGISVYLYRKLKNPGMPLVEGDQSQPPSSQANGYIKVAVAKTEREQQGNKTRSYVLFRKLVCNVKEYADDVYYVFAGEEPKESTSGTGGMHGVQLQHQFLQAFKDTSFVAEEMPFRYWPFGHLFTHVLHDGSHFNATGQYTLVSTEPPKSRIKGRMIYQWPGDEQQVVRPLGNTPFKIEVEYLINGIPVPTYAVQNLNSQVTQSSSAGFVVQENGVPGVLQTADSRMVVGTGVTDQDGNFDIEVININHKGYVGYGSYVISKTQTTTLTTVDPLTMLEEMLTNPEGPITNPDWGLNEILGQNGVINFTGWGLGIQVIGSHLGSTNVLGLENPGNLMPGSVKGGGPSQETSSLDEDHYAPPGTQHHDSVIATGPIHRVFRVQLEGNAALYYYNPATNIICNAFEINTIPDPLKAWVQEMQLTSTISKQSKENSKVIGGGIQAVVFRHPADKLPDLPAGEGDGLYRKKPLLWPDFGMPTGPQFNADLEWLWDATTEPQPSGAGSTVNPDIVRFGRLLLNFNKYQIEACSDPSQGTQYYEPRILSSLPKISNAGYGNYWDTRQKKSGLPELSVTASLSPLPSRIGARVIDHASDKSLADATVKVKHKVLGITATVASGMSDKDGYVEFNNIVQVNNQSFNLKAYKGGYHQLSDYATGPMDKFGSQYIQTALLMEPNSLLISRVVNEQNEGVQAYIMRKDTSYVLTQPNGNFSIGLPSGNNTLYVVPLDVGYFPDTLTLLLAEGNTHHPDIKVFRRKHRIAFVVTEEGNPSVKIAGAKLYMNNNQVQTTNQQGKASFEFENISYQNFSVKASGPATSFYIPQLIHFTNPETETPVTYEIRLKKGGALSGKVRLNGTPIGGARVYMQQSQQGGHFSPVAQGMNLGGSGGFNVHLNGLGGGLVHQYTIPGSSPPGGNAVQVLQEGMLPLIETYSDKNGNFTLRGIPASSTSLSFTATLDTSFTVIGESKQAPVQAGQTATLNFDLTKYDYMTIASVFGFPLKIEKLNQTNDPNVVKVTGILDLRFSESAFIFQQGIDLARVQDVVFTGQVVNGKRIGFAADVPVPIEAMNNIKLRYTEKYNIQLSSTLGDPTVTWMQGIPPVDLKIKRDNQGKGYVEGYAQIVDNSFNYPSSYLKFNNNQQFYLCNITNQQIDQKIRAITAKYTELEAAEKMSGFTPSLSASQWMNNQGGNTAPVASGQLQVQLSQSAPQSMQASLVNLLGLYGPFTFLNSVDFNLCNAAKDSLRMKLILFNAAADPFKSFISNNGSIHLNVRMQCHIPNAQPPRFTVDIPDMVLDNNNIQPATSSQALKIALEQWTLEVKNWRLDPVKGGFFSENAALRTGQLDIPSQFFNLRNDMLAIGSFQVSQINLGNGLLFLKDINPARVSLLYDPKTGSDMGGHWRLSISGEGNQPAARITGMAPHLQEDVLELEYVQLLSNQENILSIKQGKQYKVKKHPLATFTPTSISSSANLFSLAGGLDLGAPRIAPFGIAMNFTKGPGNSLLSEVQPVNMNFKGKGNVVFQSTSSGMPKFTKDSVIIAGTVEEPGSLPSINCSFRAYAAGARYEVVLKKNEAFRLFEKSGNDYQFVPDSGGMVVNKQVNDWDYLCFAGKMQNKSSSDQIKENRMKFTIFGEIQVSGSSIQAGDMASFPGFKMAYLLAEKRLIGTMHIDKQNLGAVSLNGMDAEMRIDPDGWYLSAFGEIIVDAFPIANLKAGLIIGNYPVFTTSLKQTLLLYSPTANPCKFKSGISGFYVLAGKPLINKSWGQNYGPVSGSVQVNVGLEADFVMSFAEGSTNIYAGAGIYGLAKAELSSITCTDISGTVDIRGRVEGGIFQNQLQLNGSVSTGFSVKLEQGIPSYDGCCCYGTIFNACVGSRISVGSQGFNFSFDGDCSSPECE